MAGFISLDCFPDNTAPVCRLSVPHHGVTPGTGSRSPVCNPTPPPYNGAWIGRKNGEVDLVSVSISTNHSTQWWEILEMWVVFVVEWSIEMKPGAGRPLDQFSPRPYGRDSAGYI